MLIFVSLNSWLRNEFCPIEQWLIDTSRYARLIFRRRSSPFRIKLTIIFQISILNSYLRNNLKFDITSERSKYKFVKLLKKKKITWNIIICIEIYSTKYTTLCPILTNNNENKNTFSRKLHIATRSRIENLSRIVQS